MRGPKHRSVIALMFVVCGVALRAQTNADQPTGVQSVTASALWRADDVVFAPRVELGQVPQPAGPPPTPRHTGIKAMLKGIVVEVTHLPSKENLTWASVGGGLARILGSRGA